MIKVESYARKWGNSLGVIIPKEIVEREHISEHEQILITIRKKHRAEEFFGMLAGWKKPTSKIKKKMKQGWE